MTEREDLRIFYVKMPVEFNAIGGERETTAPASERSRQAQEYLRLLYKRG